MRKRVDWSALSAGHVAVLDIETIVPGSQPEAAGFTKWPRHRPVVASLLTARDGGQGAWQFRLDTLELTCGQEADFFDALENLLPAHGVLVTANGRGFDLPNLALGAMAARHFQLSRLGRIAMANRYDLAHADICELFSNYGSAPKPSLTEICGALDIPVKVEAHGSEVADLIAQGEIERVKRYCASDVAATYVAWLHWSAAAAADDAAIALPLSGFARWIGGDPELEHLLPIAECGPARWAKGRAVQLRLAAVCREAEQRIHLGRDFGDRRPGDYALALDAPLSF